MGQQIHNRVSLAKSKLRAKSIMITVIFVPGVLAALLYVLIGQPFAAYFLDRKHLRQFPAPQVASWSSLWRIWHNLQNRHYIAVHQAHQLLGSHVRIAPNHVSVCDLRALNDIYGHGANFMKDAWYDGGAGAHRHLSDVRDKFEHQRKRRLLAHVFAQKTIVGLEPVVQSTCSVLVAQIDAHILADRPINIRRYLNYFTIDLFSRLLYSESLNCLERGDDLVKAEDESGQVYQVPFIKSLHDATVINTVLGFEAHLLPVTKKVFGLHPYAKAGRDYDNIIRFCTNRRIKNGVEKDDIFSKLLQNGKGENLNLPYGEVFAESSVMMNAGTDTTTAALTNAIYLIYKHQSVLQKLREELDHAMSGTDIPTYEQVAGLPYLRACLEESLRVRPSSTMGLPRVVPKGGRVVAGKFIEEGVTVSVPTYTILRDPTAFDEAEQFQPERWISGDLERMKKAHFPFSTGPRACIGRSIAYFEQLLVLSTLVSQFDFTFETPDQELKIVERFNGNPDELVLRCARR